MKPCARMVMGCIGYTVCIFALFIPTIPAGQYETLIWASTALLGSKAFDYYLDKR